MELVIHAVAKGARGKKIWSLTVTGTMGADRGQVEEFIAECLGRRREELDFGPPPSIIETTEGKNLVVKEVLSSSS